MTENIIIAIISGTIGSFLGGLYLHLITDIIKEEIRKAIAIILCIGAIVFIVVYFAFPSTYDEGEFIPMTRNIIASGTVGDGAPWRLYNDGALIVDSGFLNWDRYRQSPWHEHRYYIARIEFTGAITAGTSLSDLFAYLPNVTAIEGLNFFDTSNVTNMRRMFHNVSRLTTLDLSGWDTSNVIDMAWMFHRSHHQTCTLVNLNLTGWNTHNVRYMHGMFERASSLESLNLAGWNTYSVITMDYMFRGASNLTSVGNLSNWNTSSVTNMRAMFSGASSLRSVGDLSGWNTSSVISMQAMFNSASSLTDVGDLSGWNTGNVTDMFAMFQGTGLTELDLSRWNTVNVISTGDMFQHMNHLERLNVSGFDMRNVDYTGWMFNGANLLSEIVLGSGFRFASHRYSHLHNPPNNASYTGRWTNGTHSFTAYELMRHGETNSVEGVWVWERW